MKDEIIDIIQELLENDFDVELTKNSIRIIETYRSISRDEYITKNVREAFGTLKYFENGTLRITRDKLREWKKDLLANK